MFNSAKNFGFICPVFRPADAEGPPLKLGSDDGLWFFGNHSLSAKTQPGTVLSFEVWENTEGKPQARCVQLAPEQVVDHGIRNVDIERREPQPKRHVNEPRVIYPSVYISDVPVEYTEETLKDLHKSLSLNPETVMGIKFLPFTEVSLGTSVEDYGKPVAPQTGSVILRYRNEEAANAACERLRGHPIKTSSGAIKYLGARHAAPAKWMMERKFKEGEGKKPANQGEALRQKIRGIVARVSAAGYGVIRSEEWGEVMWRHYELPTNLRSLQFADPQRFQQEVQSRVDYRRLKEMEGREVEAELYRLPDGQLRASHVRAVEILVPSAVEMPQRERPRSSSGGQVTSDCIVCVRPVPWRWTDIELRERFEWYGSLSDVVIERRVPDQSSGVAEVWCLGVLRFDDAKVAAEVIRHEKGGSLEACGQPVIVEVGRPVQEIGWCVGEVVHYLPQFGLGLLRTSQVGDVHFEAPLEARVAGLDIRGMQMDANVQISSDGRAQAREVRLQGSANHSSHDAHGSVEKFQGRKSSEGMVPWGAVPGMIPGMMWGASPNPFYKTQPCPYLLQGGCLMGLACYFAHSKEELRLGPAALARSANKAAKKEKKERKASSEHDSECVKRRGQDRSRSHSWRSHGSGCLVLTEGPRGRSLGRRRRRVHLDDDDF